MQDDWSAKAIQTLKHAEVMKKNMKAKNITKAKAKCPYCDGYWHARLNGMKQHMHMSCDGDCKTMIME